MQSLTNADLPLIVRSVTQKSSLAFPQTSIKYALGLQRMDLRGFLNIVDDSDVK
jgi:hypothetical protein